MRNHHCVLFHLFAFRPNLTPTKVSMISKLISAGSFLNLSWSLLGQVAELLKSYMTDMKMGRKRNERVLAPNFAVGPRHFRVFHIALQHLLILM